MVSVASMVQMCDLRIMWCGLILNGTGLSVQTLSGLSTPTTEASRTHSLAACLCLKQTNV
jgi:hypothetical protein